MNFLIQTIVLICVSVVLVEGFKFINKSILNHKVDSFLDITLLKKQVLEKKLKYNKQQEKYQIFIRFKDEPHIIYNITFEGEGIDHFIAHVIYKLKLNKQPLEWKVIISAYDQENNCKIESPKQAKYLKYDGSQYQRS